MTSDSALVTPIDAQQPADRVPVVARDDQRAHHGAAEHRAVDEREPVHGHGVLRQQVAVLRGHDDVGDRQHER